MVLNGLGRVDQDFDLCPRPRRNQHSVLIKGNSNRSNLPMLRTASKDTLLKSPKSQISRNSLLLKSIRPEKVLKKVERILSDRFKGDLQGRLSGIQTRGLKIATERKYKLMAFDLPKTSTHKTSHSKDVPKTSQTASARGYKVNEGGKPFFH